MSGMMCEPAKHVVKAGDYIQKINNQDVDTKQELIEAITHLDGREVVLLINREGKEIKIKYIIKFVGDGWVANVDETNKEEFTQVKFESYQDNELISEYEEAFFWDNPHYFIETFNQIFR
jgi:C-terminal processing protease CtpA/Prc